MRNYMNVDAATENHVMQLEEPYHFKGQTYTEVDLNGIADLNSMNESEAENRLARAGFMVTETSFNYLFACILLGIAISTLFRHRENSLLLLLWTSIPVLMLSGVSFPREAIPDWLFELGKIFPSSSGVDAFIRIQSMGATFQDVLPQIRMLWILVIVYGGLACIGIHLLLQDEYRKRSRIGKDAA